MSSRVIFLAKSPTTRSYCTSMRIPLLLLLLLWTSLNDDIEVPCSDDDDDDDSVTSDGVAVYRYLTLCTQQ